MGYWRGKLWTGMCAGFTLLWLAAYGYGAGPATASQELPRQPDAALIDDYLGHIRAGVSAYHAQRFADATQAFEAAAVLQPSASVVYRYLAELYWRAGRPEQARQAVHTLAGLISDAYAVDQVGRVYEEAGLTALALQVYQEALELDPQFVGAHYDLGRLSFEAGALEQGIAAMQAALRLHSDFPEAHQALGMAYTELGRFDEAIVHLQRTLDLAPNLTVVRNHLGRLYLAQGQLEQAIQTFRALVERAPDVPEARHNLAVAYARQGRREEAIEQFHEALRLRPGFQQARLDVAALLMEMQRFPDAIETLKAGVAPSLIETSEGVPHEGIEISYRLGLAYRMAGQRPQAMQALRSVLQAEPTHAGAHANLSYLYYQSKDFDQAWKHARQAESLGLPVPELMAALRRVSVEPPP